MITQEDIWKKRLQKVIDFFELRHKRITCQHKYRMKFDYDGNKRYSPCTWNGGDEYQMKCVKCKKDKDVHKSFIYEGQIEEDFQLFKEEHKL